MRKSLSPFIMAPQDLFFLVGFVFGIALIVLIPPLQAPDEWMHSRRACHLSECHLMPERYVAEAAPKGSMERENVGGMLPKSYLIAEKFAFFGVPYDARIAETLMNTHGMQEDPFKAGRKFSKAAIVSLFRQSAADQGSDLVFFPNTALHSPHLYIPQAAGFALGRLLGYPPVAWLYMGRFFNLLAWLCMVCLTIRITPLGKWVFLCCALTPTSLFQSSSLSADAMTNGLSFLLVALFLRYAYRYDREKYMLPAIFLFSLLVAVSKLYFFLIVLFLLVPKERLGNRRRYWTVFALLVAATALTVFTWARLVRHLYVPFKAGISTEDQLSYLLRHPITCLSICWNTLLAYGTYYVKSFVGRLGHFPLYLPGWLVWIHAGVLLGISTMADRSEVSIGLKEKTVLGAVFLAGTFWILLVQYLSGTVVGAAVISGVQGRYFIPIAVLFLLLFHNGKVDVREKGPMLYAVLSCYLILLLTITCYVVLKGYYS